MKNAFIIASKDLMRSVRDRSAIVTAIVAPFALAFILSTVLGGEDGSSLNVTFATVDQDGGPVSTVLIDEILPSLEQEGAELVDAGSVEGARRMAEDGDIAAAFVLPEGLSEAVQSNEPAEITVIADPEAEIGGQIARGVAEGFAAELNAARLSIGTVIASGAADPSEIQGLQQEASDVPMPTRLVKSSAGGRQFDSNTFFAAGIAVFFLFFTVQLGAVSLLQERKEGTLARLLAAPVSRATIVSAKAIYSFVLGALSMTILIVASTFLMGAQWGDPLGVAVVVLSAVFAAMGLQSLVATLASTDEQAAGYGAIVGVTLGLLGGTFFPIAQGPGLISRLSFVSPHRWIMRSLGELSGGAGTLADVLPSVAVLLLFGAITGAVALYRSRSLVAAS
ncbi:MAG: ABC transporter permease subunit [Actinobacteria bacterium]|nr:ABC transporter permease subunit [Actinomycetota bacterium]